jgi:phosphate/sulfate permease
MQSAAKHIGLFGLIYNAAPCSDVFGCIMICIRNIATICTAKVFPFPFSNVKTIIAGLRGISRRDSEKFNPVQFSLISKILAQLVKTPAIQFCFLCFAFWLSSYLKIFKTDGQFLSEPKGVGVSLPKNV